MVNIKKMKKKVKKPAKKQVAKAKSSKNIGNKSKQMSGIKNKKMSLRNSKSKTKATAGETRLRQKTPRSSTPKLSEPGLQSKSDLGAAVAKGNLGTGAKGDLGITAGEGGKEYQAKQITVLDGLTPVQKRPAMFIGSVGLDGLHHLVWEVTDNCLDEAMAGYCNNIEVALLSDQQIQVSDNGRGIPIDIHKSTGRSALELVMTKLHAGGKFDNAAYKVSGGLHGVGVSVVNALSEYARAEVRRNGKVYSQEYHYGKPVKKVCVIGKTDQRGTTITFQPDPQIFPLIEFNFKKILSHLRQQAYLTKGVKITVIDQRQQPSKPYTFYFDGGIKSYVHYLNIRQTNIQPTIFYATKELKEVQVEIAFQYNNSSQENILSFANNIFTINGGSHLVGFRTALTKALNSYARQKNYLKEKDSNFSGDDVREGLTAVISVKLKDPQFEGQTKAKLGNTEIKGIVETIFSDKLQAFLEEHPREAQKICQKIIITTKARQAAKLARETVIRKSILREMTLPGKLTDCSSSNPEESEIYIVEGDSAGGSAKQGRDQYFQAILPLRGKILNVEKQTLHKVLANEEIKSLIIALGTNVTENFNLDKLRYHRIIIMTDADIDGAHIRTLLLTFFFRYMHPLIEKGHLFIAQPPLYQIQLNRQVKYAYSDEEKEKILKQLNVGGDNSKINIQRYKGLGEMNPEQLWETTMDPQQRVLKKVKIKDAKKVEELFTTLMGKDGEARKKFIQAHAQFVKNLDI